MVHWALFLMCLDVFYIILLTRCFRCFTDRDFPSLMAMGYWIIDPLCGDASLFLGVFTPWYIGHSFLVAWCFLPHTTGLVLSMFYRQHFSFIDGIGLLDHRSLVQ